MVFDVGALLILVLGVVAAGTWRFPRTCIPCFIYILFYDHFSRCCAWHVLLLRVFVCWSLSFTVAVANVIVDVDVDVDVELVLLVLMAMWVRILMVSTDGFCCWWCWWSIKQSLTHESDLVLRSQHKLHLDQSQTRVLAPIQEGNAPIISLFAANSSLRLRRMLTGGRRTWSARCTR